MSSAGRPLAGSPDRCGDRADPWAPSGGSWLRWMKHGRDRERGRGSRPGSRPTSAGGASTVSVGAVTPHVGPHVGSASAILGSERSPAVFELSREEAFEERFLGLLAGLHRQVATDRQEADRVAEVAAERLDSRCGAQEQQLQRLDRRLAEVVTSLQTLEDEVSAQGRKVSTFGETLKSLQTSRSHAEVDLQRRLGDLQLDQEELLRKQAQRLRPVEDRLAVLEAEHQEQHVSSPLGPSSPLRAEQAAFSAVRDLESQLWQEVQALHERCEHMQGVVDSRVLRPLETLERRVQMFCGGAMEPVTGDFRDGLPPSASSEARAGLSTPSGDAGAEERRFSLEHGLTMQTAELEARVRKECEALCGDLARRVHAGFEDVRSQLDALRRQSTAEPTATAGERAAGAAPLLEERGASFERIADLERQVHDLSGITSALRDGFVVSQRSLVEVKRSIDLALAERASHRNLDSEPSSLYTDSAGEGLSQLAQGSNAGPEASLFSTGVSMQQAPQQPPISPQHDDDEQPPQQQQQAKTKHGALDVAPDIAGYDTCTSLQHLAGSVREQERELEGIRSQMGELALQVERVCAYTAPLEDRLVDLEVFQSLSARAARCGGVDGSSMANASPGVGSVSAMLLGISGEGSALVSPEGGFEDEDLVGAMSPAPPEADVTGIVGPWAQADAVLKVVGDVVARQQRELASLTVGLGLQGSSVRGQSCSEAESRGRGAEHGGSVTSPRGAVTWDSDSYFGGRGELGTELGSSCRESPNASQRVRRAEAARQPRHASWKDDGSAASHDGELELKDEGDDASPVGGPWSALAHLSAALTTFDAALHRADADREGKGRMGGSGRLLRGSSALVARAAESDLEG